MKWRVLLLVGLGGSALASTAGAEPPPAPRKGLQVAFRTGYAVSMGKTGSSPELTSLNALSPPNTAPPQGKMSDYFGGQVPFLADIGGKPIPELFLGGYFGIGLGKASGWAKQTCASGVGGCPTFSVRLGLEVGYQILPAGRVDPWLAYGVGIESSAVTGSLYDASFTGYELAHLMGGVDFRLTPSWGVGPFVDFSIGSYNRVSVRYNDLLAPSDRQSMSISARAYHEWLTLGVRFVLFP